MGNHCWDGETHLERARSHLVPSGQQWILSSQHTACWKGGRSQSFWGSHKTKTSPIPGLNLYTHFQTMTATTTDSGEQCCQVWLPNIKVRPTDRLKRLTLLNRQQPMEPLGSWQQVEPSGHQDFESGHMTPAWTRPTTPHQHPHTHRLERKQGTIIL